MAAPEPAAGFAPPALPAALELLTAMVESADDPAFFWEAVQRVMRDATADGDAGRALAELLFAVTSLSDVLLHHLADAAGATPGSIISQLNVVYGGQSTR